MEKNTLKIQPFCGATDHSHFELRVTKDMSGILACTLTCLCAVNKLLMLFFVSPTVLIKVCSH